MHGPCCASPSERAGRSAPRRPPAPQPTRPRRPRQLAPRTQIRRLLGALGYRTASQTARRGQPTRVANAGRGVTAPDERRVGCASGPSPGARSRAGRLGAWHSDSRQGRRRRGARCRSCSRCCRTPDTPTFATPAGRWGSPSARRPASSRATKRRRSSPSSRRPSRRASPASPTTEPEGVGLRAGAAAHAGRAAGSRAATPGLGRRPALIPPDSRSQTARPEDAELVALRVRQDHP
jgi:hypothetical protein